MNSNLNTVETQEQPVKRGVFESSALFGVEDVRGQVFGPISHRYGSMLKTVMVWPKHGYRQEWPARLHQWWSDAETGRAAFAEYLAKNRREEKLGDGSPCITTLEYSPNDELTHSGK